jgi:hypothetical protein
MKPVEPSQIITLQAFLLALAKLDPPLPAGMQAQLNQIGSAIAENSANIGKLDHLSESHAPLNKFYQEMRSLIQSSEGIRSKAAPPTGANPSESSTTENSNISVKIDEEQLLRIAKQILTAPESVSVAKSLPEITQLA